MSTRFYQLEVGEKFSLPGSPVTFVKINKIAAHLEGNTSPASFVRINSQAYVAPFQDEDAEEEIPWDEIEDRHTTDFTRKQRDDLIEQIVERALRQYGAGRIDVDRLRKGLLCAHRAKPIRLIDLLKTCNVDFPAEVLYGVYRHYDPATDTLRNGWTAQHSEPYVDPFAWLFGKLGAS